MKYRVILLFLAIVLLLDGRQNLNASVGFNPKNFKNIAEYLFPKKGKHSQDFSKLRLFNEVQEHFTKLDTLDKLNTLYKDDAGQFSRYEKLSKKYLFLKIRTHRNSDYDQVLKEDVLLKYQNTFESKFDTDDLKVVVLGLSDDPVLSLKEADRFKRTLGKEISDEVGPLSVIDIDKDRGYKPYQKYLRPYRGKTVILVGHVPDDLDSFFIFRDGKRKKVDIQNLMLAAYEEQVKLIPLGCDSGAICSFGAEGIINSDDVLEQIKKVLDTKPRTFGDFLAIFTSDTITLKLNQFETKFYSHSMSDKVKSIKIVNDKTNEVIGRILFNRIDGYKKELRPLTYRTLYDKVNYDACFADSHSNEEFNLCVEKSITELETKADAIQEAKAIQRANAIQEAKVIQRANAIQEAKQRADRRKFIALSIQKNKEAREKNTFKVILMIPIQMIIIFLSALMFFVGMTSARDYEKENGITLQRIFLPITIKIALLNLYYSVEDLKKNSSILKLAIGVITFSLVIGIYSPLYINISVSIIVVAIIILRLLWEASKKESLSFLVSAMMLFLLLLSSSFFGYIIDKKEKIDLEKKVLCEERDNLM